ncbi:MAG: glycosyltransferase family 4 protein [Cyclobacteriaceae bacterium]
MNKKVLIDSRWAGDTGIGRLYREVMQKAPENVECSFVGSTAKPGHLLSPLILTREIRKSEAEIFYSPSFMPPLYSKMPIVFTIHDLMHLYFYSALHGIYYRQIIARLALRAKQIITVSEYSKLMLIGELNIPADLITIIYNGVDKQFMENAEKIDLGNPYFLYIGNRRNYKNIPRMLEAFSKAKIPSDFIFALSGNPDAQLMTIIKKLGIENRVRFLGFIAEQDLPKFYKGAYATLFVSQMEGFGLPLIESMASGTPTLTSSTSSLPEIANGAALCVDPVNVDAIIDGTEKLVNNQALYDNIVKKGLIRARDFSWEITASETWGVILS